MFARKKQPFIKTAQLSTLIAEGVEINGDLVFAGGTRIDGSVKGDVTGKKATDGKVAVAARPFGERPHRRAPSAAATP